METAARLGAFAVVLALQALAAFVFIRGLKLPSGWAWPVIFAFILFNFPLPYLFWLQAGARQAPFWVAALVVRPCFAWQFNWITFLFIAGPLVILGWLFAWLFHAQAIISVMRWVLVPLVLAWWSLSFYGLFDTVRPPEYNTVEVDLPGLPASEDGARVALLSDPHVAWWNSAREICHIGKAIREMDPDLFLVTGDMVDHNPDYVHAFADCMEGIEPRLGRYAIIGNHDVYTGREAVARRMQARGFGMIRNQWISLADKGSAIVLAGVEDSGVNWAGKGPATKKLPGILADCPQQAPVILMKHRPSDFKYYKDLPVDLVLSGHTHGGQFKLPFGGPGLAHMTYKYPEGLHSQGGKTTFVSRGTGTVGWPFRLFCPKQATLIILRSPDA